MRNHNFSTISILTFTFFFVWFSRNAKVDALKSLSAHTDVLDCKAWNCFVKGDLHFEIFSTPLDCIPEHTKASGQCTPQAAQHGVFTP